MIGLLLIGALNFLLISALIGVRHHSRAEHQRRQARREQNR